MKPGVGRVVELLISIGSVDFVTKNRDVLTVTDDGAPPAEAVTVVGVKIEPPATVEVADWDVSTITPCCCRIPVGSVTTEDLADSTAAQLVCLEMFFSVILACGWLTCRLGTSTN